MGFGDIVVTELGVEQEWIISVAVDETGVGDRKTLGNRAAGQRRVLSSLRKIVGTGWRRGRVETVRQIDSTRVCRGQWNFHRPVQGGVARQFERLRCARVRIPKMELISHMLRGRTSEGRGVVTVRGRFAVGIDGRRVSRRGTVNMGCMASVAVLDGRGLWIFPQPRARRLGSAIHETDGLSHCCPGSHSQNAADHSRARRPHLGSSWSRYPRPLPRRYRSSTSVSRRHREYGPHGLRCRARLPRLVDFPQPRARRLGSAIHETDGLGHCCPGSHSQNAADHSRARRPHLGSSWSRYPRPLSRRYRSSTSVSRRHREYGPHGLRCRARRPRLVDFPQPRARRLGSVIHETDGLSHCCPGSHSQNAADRSRARRPHLGSSWSRHPRPLPRRYRSSTSVPRRHCEYGPHRLRWRARLPRPMEFPQPFARRLGSAVQETEVGPGSHSQNAADHSHAQRLHLARSRNHYPRSVP